MAASLRISSPVGGPRTLGCRGMGSVRGLLQTGVVGDQRPVATHEITASRVTRLAYMAWPSSLAASNHAALVDGAMHRIGNWAERWIAAKWNALGWDYRFRRWRTMRWMVSCCLGYPITFIDPIYRNRLLDSSHRNTGSAYATSCSAIHHHGCKRCCNDQCRANDARQNRTS